MIRRAKFWLSVAVLFVVVNAAGVVMAAASHELLHTALHVLLLIPGTFIVTRLLRRNESGTADADAAVISERLRNLEQSVEAVAIEIERIGEGQRFMIRARGERVSPPVQRGPTS
jgi:hypothetical protein